MSLGLLGKKIGMTRVFDKEAGVMIPVTVVDVTGNEFLQIKTQETDGYSAVQIGFDDQKEQRLNAPTLGHLKKHGGSPKRLIQEFRFENAADLPEAGAEHPGAALFQEGQYVDVTGTTKGKGFQGVVKRYGFQGQPDGHGHMMHRRTGAIGAGTWPGRVWKGQKMPGRMGNRSRTTQSLKIIQVRTEDNAILIAGNVPGIPGSYLTVSPAVKKPLPAAK